MEQASVTEGAPFRSNPSSSSDWSGSEASRTMHYDALLAALLAGVVTLLAFLFWPAVADQLPELAWSAIIYLFVLLLGAWIFNSWRRTRRK
jgi:MFS superfamily sulfate permease-like transporter